MSKRKSVSLIEVLVGAVLLALVFGSLLTTFVAVRNYIRRSNSRLVASNLSRRILIALYNAVRQDQWGDVNSDLGDGKEKSYPPISIDNLIYRDNADNYKVEGVLGKEYRKVTTKIKYPNE